MLNFVSPPKLYNLFSTNTFSIYVRRVPPAKIENLNFGVYTKAREEIYI
jgi:hypothetical protein